MLFRSNKYGFNAEEAYRILGLEQVKLVRKQAEKAPKEKVVKAVKCSFPIPYNGHIISGNCYGIRNNNGLFTQCENVCKGKNLYCSTCQKSANKSASGVPELGTIQARNAVGIYEYVAPNGKTPIHFTKIMKRLKMTRDAVEEEAGKYGIVLSEEHFIAPENSKKGRPKVAKEVKVKGSRGRPKKEKKALVLENDDDQEDFFESLVASADEDEERSEEHTSELQSH